jgi:hypothetical protein
MGEGVEGLKERELRMDMNGSVLCRGRERERGLRDKALALLIRREGVNCEICGTQRSNRLRDPVRPPPPPTDETWMKQDFCPLFTFHLWIFRFCVVEQFEGLKDRELVGQSNHSSYAIKPPSPKNSDKEALSVVPMEHWKF